MPDPFVTALWNAHRQRIQPGSPRQMSTDFAFLEMDLKGEEEAVKTEGASFAPFIREWMRNHAIAQFFLLFGRSREEWWREPVVRQEFQELLSFHRDSPLIEGCVWKDSFQSASEIAQMLQKNMRAPMQAIAIHHRAALLSSAQPLSLQTAHIPKPWGYEEWYTGVEKRGVARIKTIEGSSELPYALSLFRQRYLRKHAEQLILLKSLNPAPHKSLGDLYLEMHEKKWEVYLVTKVDPLAWPSGVGIIKAGLHPQKVKSYRQSRGKNWLAPYLKDFERSIAAYEKTRRRIDRLLDEMKKETHCDPSLPLPPESASQFLKKVPFSLQNEEKRLREELYHYVGDHPVRTGDLITFPPYHVHSLQHGIRVIEFQTPHYERLILMSGQKVLTQDHWDTEKALSLLKPEVYQCPALQDLEKTEEWQKERIVDFPDFSVERILIRPGGEYSDDTGDDYHLWVGVEGEGELLHSGNRIATSKESQSGRNEILHAAKGLLLPASLQKYALRNNSPASFLALKAVPRS